MFQVINPWTVYDLMNENRIELALEKEKTKYDVSKLLDDVSLWMDKNRDSISDNYLPFGVLAVGIIPIQVSAFMYGLFVGKALEKHKLKVKMAITKVDKKTILEEIEKHLDEFSKESNKESED